VNKFASKIRIRFVIYPRKTPFNLEKSLFDCDERLLPLKVGLLKEEYFGNWDDDNKLNNSSLIKRGLYPEFLRAKNYIGVNVDGGKDYTLTKGQSKSYQYCPDIPRIKHLPMKFIAIKRGRLTISSDRESFELKIGQSAWLHANIKHTLLAREDCIFYSHIES